MTLDDAPRGYASPPCFAHEIDPAYCDLLAVAPQQDLDAARRRKAERAWLMADPVATGHRHRACGRVDCNDLSTTT